MSELARINLTYGPPIADFDASVCYTEDREINIKYTLMAVKNLLLENISKLDRLIEKDNDISNILYLDDGDICISSDNSILMAELKRDGVLASEELDAVVEDHFAEESETNQRRLAVINNLINYDDATNTNENANTNENSDSESDSETETSDIIVDDKNTQKIIEKIASLLEETDSDSDSDF